MSISSAQQDNKKVNMNKRILLLSGIIFIIIFPIFVLASVTTWNGYLFIEEWDLFSTKTGYSYVYHGEDDYSWINGTPYHSRCWMNVIVNSQDGFLVGNDININITNGFVDFYREGIPDVDNISIRIHFEPAVKIDNGSFVYEIRDVIASFNGKTRFEFNNLNLNLNAQYIVSGAKDIRVYALVNDSNISKQYIANYGNDKFIDIEPAYTTTQLKLAKSVVILTYWFIFFSIVTMIFKIFKTTKIELKNENQKGSINMYEKFLKYFPNAFYSIAVFIISIGIIFIILGAFFYGIGGNEVVLTGASILITLGLGCFSLGFAFLSIGIAKESDKKMKAIAYATFDEAIREIEDRRLTLQARLPILQNKVSRRKIDIPGDKSELMDEIKEFAIFYQYSIWKCKTYLDRAMNFKKYLRPKDRKEIIHQIDCLFFKLAPIKKTLNLTLDDSYKRHIQNMYDTIITFDEFYSDTVRQNRLESNRSYLKDEGATTYQSPIGN